MMSRQRVICPSFLVQPGRRETGVLRVSVEVVSVPGCGIKQRFGGSLGESLDPRLLRRAFALVSGVGLVEAIKRYRSFSFNWLSFIMALVQTVSGDATRGRTRDATCGVSRDATWRQDVLVHVPISTLCLAFLDPHCPNG
jgi:hypothetical protein